MPSEGQCPWCHRFIRLTKAGNLYRHGWKWYARNRLGFTGVILEADYPMEFTRSECTGSGKPPKGQRENK